MDKHRLRRFIVAHIVWLLACLVLIIQRLGVFLCLPLMAATSMFFMSQSERQLGHSIQAASYFWRPFPSRPRVRLVKKRVKATVLPPLDSSPKRRIS